MNETRIGAGEVRQAILLRRDNACPAHVGSVNKRRAPAGDEWIPRHRPGAFPIERTSLTYPTTLGTSLPYDRAFGERLVLCPIPLETAIGGLCGGRSRRLGFSAEGHGRTKTGFRADDPSARTVRFRTKATGQKTSSSLSIGEGGRLRFLSRKIRSNPF